MRDALYIETSSPSFFEKYSKNNVRVIIASRITIDAASAIDLILVRVSYIAQSEGAQASRQADGTNPSLSHPKSFSSLIY